MEDEKCDINSLKQFFTDTECSNISISTSISSLQQGTENFHLRDRKAIQESVKAALVTKDLTKLRAFLFEKLTTRQLKNLIAIYDAAQQYGDSTVPLEEIRNNTPNFRRTVSRNRVNLQYDSPETRNALVRFPFGYLAIGNFAIESPIASGRAMNTVIVCRTTSRLLYDTNFMLGNDWCSCVISIMLCNVEALSVSRDAINLLLNSSAIVESSYKNCEASLLDALNNEICHNLIHRLVMRSTQELIELKTAMFLADPSLVHKMERTEASNLTYGSTKYNESAYCLYSRN